MILDVALSSAVYESSPAKHLYRFQLAVLQLEALSQAKQSNHRRCERVSTHGVSWQSNQLSNMDFRCM